MSFTEDTYYTLIKKGLKTKNGTIIQANRYVRTQYPPAQIKDFSVTFTPVMVLGTRTEVYTNSYNTIIYEPPTILSEDPSHDPNFVPNVASVRFTKPTNTSVGSMGMFDSNGNELSSEPVDFPNGKPTEIYIPQPTGWIVDDSMVLSICLMCLQNANGDPISAGFGLCQLITPLSKIESYDNPGKDTIALWDYIGSIGTDGNFMANLDAWLYGDYYDPTGNAGHPDENPNGSEGGFGDGQFPNHSIGVPNLPTKSACSSGFMRIYNITEAKLNELASELWNPSFWNTIVKNFESPFENIISLGLIPYSGFFGTLEPIQIGNYESNIQADALANTYYELDCGNVTFHTEWLSQSFLDFEPHFKMQVYLPYCGVVDVSPSEFQYKTMNIKYHFDIFSGSCVAFIIAIGDGVSHVLYQKEGNIKTELPINAQNYTNVYNNAIGSVFSLAGAGLGVLGATAMMGGAGITALGVAGAGLMAGKSISNMASVKPDYQRAGNIGGCHGLMGVQIPYVICTLPNSIEPSTFKELHGYVSKKSMRIGDVSGFLSANVDMEKLNNINCTDTEKQMLQTALASGIFA